MINRLAWLEPTNFIYFLLLYLEANGTKQVAKLLFVMMQSFALCFTACVLENKPSFVLAELVS